MKLRGYRVELGEIEAVLRRVEGVAEALVVADQAGSGEPRLVAYWVGAAARDALVAAARSALPEYTVPAVFVPVLAFPLNTNGKIDRKLLPPPTDATVAGTPGKPASDDTEARLVAIYRDVLKLDSIGVDQSFFTLGGTSLLAMQAVASIEREMGMDEPHAPWMVVGPEQGWGGRASQVTVVDVPGNHLQILQEPQVGRLAQAVAAACAVEASR